MCEWGSTVPVHVRLAADLSCTGKSRWRWFGIDRCIAPLVRTLQAGGVDMRSSCCGHGKGDGEIVLASGDVLRLQRRGEETEK